MFCRAAYVLQGSHHFLCKHFAMLSWATKHAGTKVGAVAKAVRTVSTVAEHVWLFAGRWNTESISHGRLERVPLGPLGTVAAASVSHALIADPAGTTIFASGQNGHGQLGTHSKSTRTLSTSSLCVNERIHTVAAGLGFSLAASERTLYACGTNVRGQIGLGPVTPDIYELKPIPLPRDDVYVDEVCAGLDHTLVLASQPAHAPHASAERTKIQYLWACGLHTDNQLGLQTNAPYLTQFELVHLDLEHGEQIARISAQGDTSAVLTSRGRVFMWGNTEYGQYGFDAAAESKSSLDRLPMPTLLPVPPGICDLCLGGSFLLLLDGTYETRCNGMLEGCKCDNISIGTI